MYLRRSTAKLVNSELGLYSAFDSLKRAVMIFALEGFMARVVADQVRCGCGSGHAVAVGPDAVRIGNTYWSLHCAVQEAARMLDEAKRRERLAARAARKVEGLSEKYQNLRALVSKLLCTSCSWPVGDKFAASGCSLYCGKCFDELFGGELPPDPRPQL